jgi:hypothetical protein
VSFRASAGSFFDTYNDQGLMVIEVLTETESGAAPTQEDLAAWTAGHGFATVADPGSVVAYSGYVNGGIPAISMIAPGGEITLLNQPGGVSEDQITSILP